MESFKKFTESENLSVGMVITYNDKILIVRRGSSAPWMPEKWSLVGGMVDNGEDLERAIKREVYEETKIKPENIELVGDYDKWYVFKGTTDFKQVDLEMENMQFDWITINELDDYDFVPHAKQAILDALT